MIAPFPATSTISESTVEPLILYSSTVSSLTNVELPKIVFGASNATSPLTAMLVAVSAFLEPSNFTLQ